MVNCLVVEDEPLAQQVLARFIEEHPRLRLAAVAANATDAFRIIHDQTIHLIFLDIRLPAMKGTDFISALKNPPAFIFTTAYPQYALQGYELEAIDYLLKPVTYDRFEKAVNRFLRLRNAATEPAAKNYVYIKESGKLVKTFFDDIYYAESMKDYLRIKTKGGTLVTHTTMKNFLELLPSSFLRLHRSYVVNMSAAAVLARDHVVIAGTNIPVGENFKAAFDKWKEENRA
jgi:DNA-binding LytR/AlgR family response regulator